MTFFYDLNKKLDSIREKPETTHKQLNERDMSRAAKGYEKYGKEGMQALAKAGREGKSLDKIRDKYNKYDESVEEGSTGDYSAKKARAGKDIGKPGKQFAKIAASAEKRGAKSGAAVAGKVLKDLRAKNESVEEGQLDELSPATLGSYGRKAAGQAAWAAGVASARPGPEGDPYAKFQQKRVAGVKQAVGKGADVNPGNVEPYDWVNKGGYGDANNPAIRKRGMKEGNKFAEKVLKAKADGIQPGEKVSVGGKEYPVKEEGGKPMTPKQKKFAKLAPPTDKITFADKIAGAKKEVDEMLGDVAAEAMRKAVRGNKKVVADEGWDEMEKMVKARANKPKVGDVERGHKHDIEHTATGRKVTRRHDDKGISVGADDEEKPAGEKRGRGRPKKANKAPERVTGKAYKHKGGRKVADESEEELDEKAVSKKQQRFMGMVHAAQKGEKPASKEVAKVAKTMKKKDAEDFASTKHKGLPEKKKSEGKKREKTEEQGGTDTPTASSGFSFGKGIYDSMNRDLENMIKESMARLDESMSINVSSSTEGGKNISVTASDEDAVKLATILKNAGLGGGAPEGGEHGEITSGPEIEVVSTGDEEHNEPCETCGSMDCGCGDVHEALDENNPDWPTDEVEAHDNLEYAGGLNGPKSTGQTVGAPFNRQNARQGAGELVGNGVNEDFERFKSLAQKVGGAVKSAAKKGIEKLGHGDDEAMIKDLQKKMGVPQTGKKPESGKVAESLRAALEQYKKQ